MGLKRGMKHSSLHLGRIWVELTLEGEVTSGGSIAGGVVVDAILPHTISRGGGNPEKPNTYTCLRVAGRLGRRTATTGIGYAFLPVA